MTNGIGCHRVCEFQEHGRKQIRRIISDEFRIEEMAGFDKMPPWTQDSVAIERCLCRRCPCVLQDNGCLTGGVRPRASGLQADSVHAERRGVFSIILCA